MTIIPSPASTPVERPPAARAHRLSDELRLDVLGHRALAGLEWTAPASHVTDEVLDLVDDVLAEVTR